MAVLQKNTLKLLIKLVKIMNIYIKKYTKE